MKFTFVEITEAEVRDRFPKALDILVEQYTDADGVISTFEDPDGHHLMFEAEVPAPTLVWYPDEGMWNDDEEED